MKFAFWDGQSVEYQLNTTPENNGVWFKGNVVGFLDQGVPVLGRTILIKDEQNFPNSVYPFQVFPIFEMNLRPAK